MKLQLALCTLLLLTACATKQGEQEQDETVGHWEGMNSTKWTIDFYKDGRVTIIDYSGNRFERNWKKEKIENETVYVLFIDGYNYDISEPLDGKKATIAQIDDTGVLSLFIGPYDDGKFTKTQDSPLIKN